MSTARLDKYLPVLLHGLAWVIYGVLVVNGNAARYTSLPFFILRYGLIITVHATVFYANFRYLIPNILVRLCLPVFLGHNIALITVLSVATIVILDNTMGLLTSVPKVTMPNFPVKVMIRMINNGFFMLLALVIRFSVDWYQQKRTEKELENGRLKTELAFLKAQINPHFLFNALNNVYALSLKQAPETPDVILKISQLMRYLLYETNDQKVLLSDEIELVRTYIAIMQLRNQNKSDVALTITGDYQKVLIEPLLLLPIIENIFKHGTYPIVIGLHVSRAGFGMETQNKIRLRISNEKTGIGLQNLSRRLELLYPDQHEFSITEQGNVYRSTLSLNFSQTDIDLLFLDIDMPDVSGFDFLRSLQKPPLIIFTTAYSQYALEGFEADAVDYLLKPIAFDRFLKATQKAQFRLSDNKTPDNGYFFVKSDHKNVRVDFEEILFIEGRKDYTRIHTANQKIDTLLIINVLVEKLPVTNFIRVHRSFVVALNKITAVERNVIFVGSQKIPIGDLYRDAFMKRIS